MASSGPPTGWDVLAGAWGTHFDREESLKVTGTASIKVLPGASSERILVTDWISVGFQRNAVRELMEVWTWLRTDDAALSVPALVEFELADENKTTITGTSTVKAQNASFTGFEAYGIRVDPVGAVWGRLKYTFDASDAATHYIGGYLVQFEKPWLWMDQDLQPTVLSTGWTTINLPTKNDTGTAANLMRSTAADDHIWAYEPGWYQVSVSVPIANVEAGDTFDIRLFRDRPNVQYYGSTLQISVDRSEVWLHMSCPVLIEKVWSAATFAVAVHQQLFRVEVRQPTGTARTTGTGGTLVAHKLSR